LATRCRLAGRHFLSRLRGNDLRQTIDEFAHALFVALQIAELLPLRRQLVGNSAQNDTPLLALREQAVMRFLLPAEGERQLVGLLAGGAGERLFVVQGRCHCDEQLRSGATDGFQIEEVARQLIRVVAVEQKAQGIGIAALILTVKELFELPLLSLQASFELARVLVVFLQFAVQFVDSG